MSEDAELLRRYADEKSEAAFAELVRRHLPLVYSVAFRQVGSDAHLAEDVAQQVFAALARKARALALRPALSGWLYRSAHFAASDVVRAERRRRERETAAHFMDAISHGPAAEADWEKIRPVLDAAIAELPEPDRDAVSLRFFEGRSFAEVGARLRLNENTARMRVARALDKLHAELGRRGVTSTAAALGVALANQAAVAAPAGLAASVTGTVLAGSGAAVGAGAWAATFMSISKIQVGIVSALVATGATAFVLQGKTNAALQREIAAVTTQSNTVAALRVENRQLASAAAEVAELRHDDAELERLSQDVVEAKKRTAELARVAQADATALRVAQLKAQLQEMDRKASDEVSRMNEAGNALVEEYKNLSRRANDPSLGVEAKAQADASAKAKMAEIQAKQREIQTFIQATREVITKSPAMAELRSLGAAPQTNQVKTISPEWTARTPATEGGMYLRNSPPAPDPNPTPASPQP